MANEFDVIVVGAGPGGSAAAIYCTNAGLKTLLLEAQQFPRDKTCGDAISGKSMSVIKDFGLEKEIEASPHAVVRGVIFSAPNGTEVDIPIPNNAGGEKARGYVCRREVFDNLVFQKAKKSANKTIENFKVTELIQENGFVYGICGMKKGSTQIEEFRSKIVIGADGANSVVANKVGVGTIVPDHHCLALRAYYDGVKNLSDRIELHFVDEVIPGYFWIFPLENGMSNVGVGMVLKDMQNKKMNLQVALEKIIQSKKFRERFEGAKLMNPIKGWALPFGSYRRKISGNGYLLIGDAASLIDPFSGEGIGNAMSSARIASRIIKEAFESKDFSGEFLKQYDIEVWKEFGPELDQSYRMQKLGRNTLLLNFLISQAARNKKVRDAISGMLVNEVPKRELVSPLFYLRMMLPF